MKYLTVNIGTNSKLELFISDFRSDNPINEFVVSDETTFDLFNDYIVEGGEEYVRLNYMTKKDFTTLLRNKGVYVRDLNNQNYKIEKDPISQAKNLEYIWN